MLAGDIASNPGPESNQNNAFRCLSFNAQSLKRDFNFQDLEISRSCNFQDLVYSENLDITITETWLNDTISNNELLPSGYNIVRRDRLTEKCGGGVLIALRESIQYNTVTLNDHPNLKIVAVELETKNSKCLLSVCYRPPNSDIKEWLKSFMSFLQSCDGAAPVFITFLLGKT